MALAESPNPHEADTAMAKAQELIARYNLDLLAGRKNGPLTACLWGDLPCGTAGKIISSPTCCRTSILSGPFGFRPTSWRRERWAESWKSAGLFRISNWLVTFMILCKTLSGFSGGIQPLQKVEPAPAVRFRCGYHRGFRSKLEFRFPKIEEISRLPFAGQAKGPSAG